MVLSHKHFTATAFVLHPNHDKILLHWHKKVNEWLPPGGHIENNEIPEEAVIREVYEESGLSIKLFSNKDLFKKIDPVKELEKPESILLEPIDDPKDGKHFHIAMIYFAESLGVNPDVLLGAWKKNLDVRPEEDWKNLKGRAVVEERSLWNMLYL